MTKRRIVIKGKEFKELLPHLLRVTDHLEITSRYINSDMWWVHNVSEYLAIQIECHVHTINLLHGRSGYSTWKYVPVLAQSLKSSNVEFG